MQSLTMVLPQVRADDLISFVIRSKQAHLFW